MINSLYDCFKHWSAKGSVYIYSDPHFDDSDCKLMDSKWPDPQEQIEIINNKVKKTDTLIILGDIGNTEWIKRLKAGYKILIAGNHDAGLSNYKKTITKEIKEISSKLDNNFSMSEDEYEENIISEMKSFRKELNKKYPYSKIEIEERYEFHSPFHYFVALIDDNLFDEVYGGPLFISDKIVLSHEPIDLPFGLNIHGHCHDGIPLFDGKNHFNVCSNVIGYEPVNLGKVIEWGYLNRVETIHRLTIDKATIKKMKVNEKTKSIADFLKENPCLTKMISKDEIDENLQTEKLKKEYQDGESFTLDFLKKIESGYYDNKKEEEEKDLENFITRCILHADLNKEGE